MWVADQLDSAVRSLQRLSGCMSVPTAYFRVHTDSQNLQSVGRTVWQGTGSGCDMRLASTHSTGDAISRQAIFFGKNAVC